MTLILDLPEELAAQLTSMLPEADRDRFAVAAIAEALASRQQAGETRLVDSLLAVLDPGTAPEREAVECRAIVEGELSESDLCRDTITLDDARRRWAAGTSKTSTAIDRP